MSDLNIICLFGRITKDAEQKKTEKGTEYVQFSIAVNRDKFVSEGNVESVPSFFLLRIYGKWGASLYPYLKKGQAITLEGHLVQLRWEKDGQFFSRIDIVPDNIRLVGSVNAKSTQETQKGVEVENETDIEKKIELTETQYQESQESFPDDLELF